MNLNKIKVLFVLIILSTGLSSRNVYVDASSGSDNFSGEETFPFKTIQKAANAMNEGDVCYIKRGIYRETVIPHKDGLTFKSYNDEYVLITGLDVLKGWEDYKNSIVKTASIRKVTQVFVDGKRMNWARYPNEDGDMFTTAEMSDVTIQRELPTGRVDFHDMPAKPVNYWKGGYFVGLASTRNWWTAHRGKIESSNDNYIFCNELSALWKTPNHSFAGDGKGYIIGTLSALDTVSEWHWQDSVLYLYPPKGSYDKNQIIEGRTRIHGFDLSDRNNIILEGLHFKAADIHMPNANGCIISKCTVRYPGIFSTFYKNSGSQREAWGDYENGASGIFVGGNYNLIKDCYVGKTWTHGVSLWGNHNMLVNSIIEHTNWMGERTSAVWCPGNDNKLINNTMRFTGRDGIELGNNNFEIKYAKRALIQYNHVHHVSYLCPDAGFLYTNHQGGDNEFANTEISFNVMHDNVFNTNRSAHGGIYLDNGSSGYQIHHNVIWNSQSGVHINDFSTTHRPKEVHVYNNTLVGVQYPVRHNFKGDGGITTLFVKNNLSDSTGFEGTCVSNNLTVEDTDFNNYSEHDYSLNKNSIAINAGEYIEGITVDIVGKPDVGAFEYGIQKWAFGSNIVIPVFIDETGELNKLPDNGDR